MATPHATLALALLALTLPAAADLEMTRKSGLIGEALVYDLQGDPNEIYVWLPSLNNGPLPLIIFDGIDPRVMEIGFDLLFLQQIGFLDGTGFAQAFLFIPNDPTLIGAPFHAQPLSWPGTPTIFDDLGNLTSTRLATHGTTHYAFNENASPRQGHSLTLLDDGRALVLGGDETDTLGNLTPVDTVELYDPQTMRFSTGANTLTSERSTHTATKLADGRVLIVGGYDSTLIVDDNAEIFDASTGISTPTSGMGTNRTQHTATLLADGRVFVAGGSDLFDLAQPVQSILGAHASTQVYDPVTGNWSAGPNLPKPRVGHSAVLLDSGKVLIMGGVEVTVVIPGILEIPSVVADCRLYDPVTNSLSGAGALTEPRVFHDSIKLDDGRVLTIAGADANFTALTIDILGTTELYAPGSNSWSASASLNHARAYPNIVKIGTDVHVLGGLATVDINTGSGVPEKAIESIDASLAAWSNTGTMAEFREVGRAVAVEGGDRILTVGAAKDDPVTPTVILKNAEVFVP